MSAHKKYYWYVYVYNNAGGGKTYDENTCDIHPFDEMKRIDKISGRAARVTLINWKQITAAEADLFHTD